MSQEFRIRQAKPEDVAVIGWHRARMFQDMGLVPDELFESFRTEVLVRLTSALASGDYVGWLVSEPKAPEKITAGAGVIIRVVPPFPHRREDGKITIAEGRQGLIVNVFTEPECRRRGQAERPVRFLDVEERLSLELLGDDSTPPTPRDEATGRRHDARTLAPGPGWTASATRARAVR